MLEWAMFARFHRRRVMEKTTACIAVPPIDGVLAQLRGMLAGFRLAELLVWYFT